MDLRRRVLTNLMEDEDMGKLIFAGTLQPIINGYTTCSIKFPTDTTKGLILSGYYGYLLNSSGIYTEYNGTSFVDCSKINSSFYLTSGGTRLTNSNGVAIYINSTGEASMSLVTSNSSSSNYPRSFMFHGTITMVDLVSDITIS